MKMKRKIILLFLILSNSFIFSQKKIYLDEGLKVIDSIIHRKKCFLRNYYSCTSFTKDSTIYNIVSFKYKMGRLTKEAHAQVLNVIALQTKQKINKKNNLLIRFTDTLFDYETIRKKHAYHIKQYKPYTIFFDGKKLVFKEKLYTKNRYHKILNNRNAKIKKCNTIYNKKENTKLFYFYNYAIKNSKKLESNLWIKDKGLLKQFFFKKTNTFKFLILKANGDYFLYRFELL